MRRGAKTLCLCLALTLCACVAPRKITQLQQDKARYDQQQSERAVNDRCNEEAMPGTPQHFACRMSGAK